LKEPIRNKTTSEEGTGFKAILTDVRIMVAASCGGVSQLMLGGIESVIPTYLATKYYLSPLGIGLFYAVLLFSFVVGSLATGKYVNRFFHKRYEIMSLGLLLYIATTVIAVVIPNFYVQALFLSLGAASYALVATPQIPAVNEIIERKYGGKFLGAGSALANICWSIGAILGPIGLSAFTEYLGFVTGSLIMMAILFVYSVGFFYLMVIRSEKVEVSYVPLNGLFDLALEPDPKQINAGE